jgi:hypothetical protein
MALNRFRLAEGMTFQDACRALDARAPLPPKMVLVPDSPVDQSEVLGQLIGWLRRQHGIRVALSVAHPPRISPERLEGWIQAGLSTLDWRVASPVPQDYDRGMGGDGALDAAIAWLDAVHARGFGQPIVDGGRQFPTLRLEAWIPVATRGVRHPTALADLVARLDGRVHAIRLALWPRRDATGREAWPSFDEVADRLSSLVAAHEARPPSAGRSELDVDGSSGLVPCLLPTDAARACIHLDPMPAEPGLPVVPPPACRSCAWFGRCLPVRSGRIVPGGPGGWADSVRPVAGGQPGAAGPVEGADAGYGSRDRRLLHVPQARHASYPDWLAGQWESDVGRSSGASRIDLVAGDRTGGDAGSQGAPVLLCRLPVPGRGREDGQTWLPPLSMVLLASSLGRAGHPVTVIDLAAEACARGTDLGTGEDGGDALLAWCRTRLQTALDRTRDTALVGFSIEDARSVPLASGLAETVGTGAWRVVGGRGVAQGKRLLQSNPSFDVVIEGEGEVPLEWVAARLAAGRSLNGIPGTCFRQGGGVMTAASAEHALDLAATPDVSWIDFDNYRDSQFPFEGRQVLPYMFVHGCPFHCAFCADYTGGRMRMRAPGTVVEHLSSMVARTGVRDFLFLNTLVNASPAYLDGLLDGLLAARLDLRWSDSAKPRGLDLATLHRMRAAGCVALTWGIDAGSLRLNRSMHKGFDMAEGSRILQWTHEAGIESVVNLIAGLPHETDEDVAETIEWLRRHRPFVNRLNVMPYRFNANSLIHLFPERFGIRPSEDGAGYHEVDGRDWATIRDRAAASRDTLWGEASRLGYRPGVRSTH